MNKKPLRCCLRLCLLLIFCLLPTVAGAVEATVVDSITVVIVPAPGAAKPPVLVAKRMAASVNTVGEHVLLGHKVADIAANEAAYEKIIQEVFDRVLIGYEIYQVQIEPGNNSTITLEVAPWGDTVEKVDWEYDYGGLSPEMVALLKKDLGNLEEKADNVLLGLPVDAVDWAGAVTKTLIRDIFDEQLPEFRPSMDIVPGQHTMIRVSVVPMGKTIQNTTVSMRSETIPNLLLFQMRPAVDALSRQLRGLPVAFVERHNTYFTGALATTAVSPETIRKYGLTVNPVINAGQDTDVLLQVETSRYKLWLEGYLDFGRQENNTSAKLHIGKYLDNRNEAFFEAGFLPGTVSWELEPGWGHRFTASTTAGFKYELTHGKNILWLRQHLSPSWDMRLEHTLKDHHNELGIRYKLHEFASLEYVVDENDHWLRLVGNL